MTTDAEKNNPSFGVEDVLSHPDLLHHFFEDSLDLFCIADDSGYFLKVNPRFEEVLGYTAEELTSRPMMEFVHPEDRQATAEALADLSEDRDVEAFRNRYICEDDSIIWLEWQSRPIGEVIFASARNITDLKRAQAEREKLQAQFQQAQKLESVGILAGGIAHDFNNLLTTIMGNAGLIPMLVDEDNPACKRARAIKDAADTASDLCEQLLAYAGEGQFNVKHRDLTRIVEETDHLLEASVDSSAQLDLDLAPTLPAAELDDTQVRQILMNLVKNASEALDGETGRIRIETGKQHCGADYLASCYLDDQLEPGEYVYLEVSDTGCGMTRAEIKRIFDPFYSTKFVGRGLGLAATLGIVRAHNGALRVDSELDKGTTFRFLFPAVATNQPFTPQTPLPAARPLKSTVVMVVENKDEIAEFVRYTLRQEDVEVLLAADGQEALHTLRNADLDVAAVILDNSLPNVKACELFQQLRDIQPALNVILSSGGPEAAALAPFPDEVEFLPKPYGPEQLFRVLARSLSET